MTAEVRHSVAIAERDIVLSEIKRTEPTARSFNQYCRMFGYTRENLKNKVILDIGSGFSYFAQEARAFGARVVKLDRNYSILAPEEKEEKRDAVTAAAQYLPFKDNIFDETISSYCLYHIETGINKTIQEMIRVTKPNGKIKIHPVYGIGLTYFLNNEPTLFLGEKEGANTLVICKEPSYSDDRWGALVDKITSSLSFSEIINRKVC
jgi:SAM-dependent methyltransferase